MTVIKMYKIQIIAFRLYSTGIYDYKKQPRFYI